VFRSIVAAAGLFGLVAAPAAAATWAFGGTAGNALSYSATVSNVPTLAGPLATVTFTAQARRFIPLPATLTNISQLIPTTAGLTPAALRVDRTTAGIGVVGGANTQLDTNMTTQYEGLLLTANNLVRLRGVTLSQADPNDTLQVYGIRKIDGALISLGFPGLINTGLAGTATFVSTPGTGNESTTALTFNNKYMNFYSGFLFTTRNPGNIPSDGDIGQGYRLNNITVEVLPEPGSWALMIVGFGLIGGAMRRSPRPSAA
jgi:hypothetical protein